MSNKYDFNAWLETKNPGDGYRFSDGCGECLMGQFMSSIGVAWDFNTYNEYVRDVLDDRVYVLSQEPQTFGAAKQRLKALIDA